MAGIVECHSGYAYAERPTAIWWDGRRLEIVEVLTRSRTPEGKHFRVRTTENQVFDLSYDEQSDAWMINQP